MYPPYYIGGYELRCQDTVDELRRRGHSVLVLTSTYGVRRPVNEGYVLRQLLIYRYGLAQILSTGKLRLVYTEWWNTRRLIHLIKSFSPDIVFVWNLRGLSMSLLVTAQRLGVPLVYSIGDTWLIDAVKEDEWFNLWNYVPEDTIRAMAKRGLQRCGLRKIIDHYIPTNIKDLYLSNMCFVSEDLKRQYLERGVNVRESRVIYRGIDVDKFNMPVRDSLNTPTKLLFCGRLTPNKGVHLAIEAMAYLMKGYSNLSFNIVGEGPEEYRQWLDRLIADNDIRAYVNFLGKVPRTQMPEIYHSHDILLFTSIWKEALGITILEAMACGVAVVGSRVGGSRKIEQLVQSPQLWARLREEGRKTVVERFSLKTMVDKMEEFLYRVANAHRC